MEHLHDENATYDPLVYKLSLLVGDSQQHKQISKKPAWLASLQNCSCTYIPSQKRHNSEKKIKNTNMNQNDPPPSVDL